MLFLLIYNNINKPIHILNLVQTYFILTIKVIRISTKGKAAALFRSASSFLICNAILATKKVRNGKILITHFVCPVSFLLYCDNNIQSHNKRSNKRANTTS